MNKNDIAKEVSDLLAKNNIIAGRHRLLVALSGGIDSVVLFDILIRLGYNVYAAHCNYKLRGDESDGDAAFVKYLCDQHKVKLYIKEPDIHQLATENGWSVQMAARHQRYTFFKKIALKDGLDFITTAHHKNDRAETILYNFLSGKGPETFKGIPFMNENIVRPLFNNDKTDITQYAIEHQLTWREDSSNKKIYYRRNFIRNHIMPILQQLNPSVTDSLIQNGEAFQGYNEIVQHYHQEHEKQYLFSNETTIQIDISTLMQLPSPELLMYLSLRKYGFNYYTAHQIIQQHASTESRYFYSSTYKAVLSREKLSIAPLANDRSDISEIMIKYGEERITLPDGHFIIEEFEKTGNTIEFENDNCIVYLDKVKLKFPLALRKWRQGDSFYPLGGSGRQKISDLFINLKLSPEEKESSWLLLSDEEIAWVAGRRSDERFKIDPATQQYLKIKYIKSV